MQGVHGKNHPEVGQIARIFADVANEMTMHMMKEENILFPYVRALAAAAEQGGGAPPAMFGSVRNPIRMMEMEHQGAGGELEALRALTANFTVPEDGCATYRACLEALAAFDTDLRTHIHLENNVLFPKAVALEAAVAGTPGGAR